MTLTVFGSTPTLDIADEMGTAMSAMSAQILSVVAVVLPIALGVVGAFIAIRKTIGFIKGVVGR
jgi:hypothetical protein